MEKRALFSTICIFFGVPKNCWFFFYHCFSYYFCREISQKGKELLLIQCDTGDENSSLVECARYCVQRELQTNELDLYVIFLVHLSRVSKSFFSGFQVNTDWKLHVISFKIWINGYWFILRLQICFNTYQQLWFSFQSSDRTLDFCSHWWAEVDFTPLHPRPYDKVNIRNLTGESLLWSKFFRGSWIWIGHGRKFTGRCKYSAHYM